MYAEGYEPRPLEGSRAPPSALSVSLTCEQFPCSDLSPPQMLWDLFPDSAPSILYHVLPRVCSRKQGSLTSPAQGVTGLVPDAGALD